MEKLEQPTPEAEQVQSVTTEQQQEQEALNNLLDKAQPVVNGWFRRQFLPIVLVIFFMEAVTVFGGYLGWEEWRPTLQLGAAVFTALGTVVIVWGALPTPRTAAMMSTTRWDGNHHLLVELWKNRKAAWAGLLLILLGFVMQLAVFGLERFNID